MKLADKRILITSDEPWTHVWHTQLYYADQLSIANEVFFMGPPYKWSPSNIFKKTNIERITEGLSIINYNNILPSALKRSAVRVNDWFNESYMYKAFNKHVPDIVWHFDPFRGFWMFRNGKTKHIYHVIDPYFDKPLDPFFARNADLVVVTSPRYLEHYQQFNSNTICVPQGIDQQLINNFYDIHINTKVIGGIVLLGSITEKVNFALITEISDLPGVRLTIIGPDMLSTEHSKKVFSELTSRDNVHYTGPLPPDQFNDLLKINQFGVIAYKHDEEMRNEMRSPLKVISYLANHMPVISNIECEIPNLIDNAIYQVRDHETYVKMVIKAIKGELVFNTDKVYQYLDSISYNRLIEKITTKL